METIGFVWTPTSSSVNRANKSPTFIIWLTELNVRTCHAAPPWALKTTPKPNGCHFYRLTSKPLLLNGDLQQSILNFTRRMLKNKSYKLAQSLENIYVPKFRDPNHYALKIIATVLFYFITITLGKIKTSYNLK